MTIGYHLDEEELRSVAVKLALYAVNDDKGRDVGDPVHEEVTEGRTKEWEVAKRQGLSWALKMIYSSCGDLAAWLLWRLGCRDDNLMNRTNDDGIRNWIPGRNTTAITGSKLFIRGTTRSAYQPQPGDILFTMNAGGHIAIVLDWDPVRKLVTTADYGQPYGRKRVRELSQQNGLWYIKGKTDTKASHILGWINIASVPFVAEPDYTGIDA